MEIRVLRYYLAVARELNITRAAESLHISQPSLSKQMMDLEDHIGKKLFIRGKRKIELTEDGILLKKRAEEIIELVQKTEDEMAQDTHVLSGDLYLGGSTTKKILQETAILIEKYPHIQLHFYSNDAIDISERLNHGLLDFAVMLEPIDTTKFNYLSLNEKTKWGVLMKKESPFSHLETITPKELKTMPLILHQRLGLQERLAHWVQKKYFEVGSCSNLGDAQARRLKIRVNGEDGTKYLAHTLNNTVVAPPRMLIAFLENNLQADGSVKIPEALRPYMGGMEVMIPQK